MQQISMQREVELQLAEVKIVGLSLIKMHKLTLKQEFTYRDFCNAVKEKIEQFDDKKYTVFLPQLAGVVMHQHNFKEFMERATKKDKGYSEIHIQKNPIDRELGLKVAIEDQKFDNDNGLYPVNESLLEKIFVDNPSDSSIMINQDDARLLEALRVIVPAVPPKPTFQELKADITNQIVKRLLEC